MKNLITSNEHGTLSVNSYDTPGARMVVIETVDEGKTDSLVLVDRREIEAVIDALSDILNHWDNNGPID